MRTNTRHGSTLRRIVFSTTLGALILGTMYALWSQDGPAGTSARAPAAAAPRALELEPPAEPATIRAEELLTVPVAPERQPETLFPDPTGELAALERTPRREVVETGEDSPSVDMSSQALRILNGRIDARAQLLVSKEQTYQVFVSGEMVRFTNLAVSSVLEDGLNTTEHSPGVPASQGYVSGGLKTGMWTTWHANGGKESEGPYTYGEMHSRWTTWHDSGEKASEGEYLYGTREGPWIEYHPNGKKRETATYVNGQRDGRVTTWHVNGARKSEMFYSFGRQHLESREWYLNGQESRRATFEYGQQVGRVRVWNSDGTLDSAQSGVYEGGQKVRD